MMARTAPSILVVADDPGERSAIAAMLRETGFAAITASGSAEAIAVLPRRDIAAAVVVLARRDGVAELRARQPGMPVVLVLAADASDCADAAGLHVVRQPCDPRHLLARIFELVMCKEDADATAARHSRAAELGIAAAALACLHHRHAVAIAAGAGHLAQELTHQIGERLANFHCLAAAGT